MRNQKFNRMIIELEGRQYDIFVCQKVNRPPIVPRLIVVAYQPNQTAKQILRVCLQSVARFTPEPHELWVIDNNSPPKYKNWLLDFPDVNLVFNNTEPIPPEGRNFVSYLISWMKGKPKQQMSGSYANAIGLEIGTRLIDPSTNYLVTLHMDTMPVKTGWLTYLQSKISDDIKAGGVRMDKLPHRTPEGVLHILGCLVDFQIIKELNLDFFPLLPKYDVGDRITVDLRNAGFDVFACPNSLWEPILLEKLPLISPFRFINVDHSFDGEGNVIFLHLGRGVRKSLGKHFKKTNPQEWIEFADKILIS